MRFNFQSYFKRHFHNDQKHQLPAIRFNTVYHVSKIQKPMKTLYLDFTNQILKSNNNKIHLIIFGKFILNALTGK